MTNKLYYTFIRRNHTEIKDKIPFLFMLINILGFRDYVKLIFLHTSSLRQRSANRNPPF